MIIGFFIALTLIVLVEGTMQRVIKKWCDRNFLCPSRKFEKSNLIETFLYHLFCPLFLILAVGDADFGFMHSDIGLFGLVFAFMLFRH